MKEGVKKIWIDESGDCGFKFEKGSSRFFVIAAVYTVNDSKIKQSLKKLRQNLNLSSGYEFKFSRCKDDFKDKFFEELLKFEIEYKAIFVDKEKTAIINSEIHPKQLYCELVRRLLYDNRPPLEKAVLIIDESAAQVHHKEFNGVLKKYLSRNTIGKIRQARSKTNHMIQVADMISGSIFRKLEKGEQGYYLKVRSKEKVIIEF